MLRSDLADDLLSDELDSEFVRPAWEDYCFANIPDTIFSLFGDDARRPLPADVFREVSTDIEHVVLVFVDGFGWNHFQRTRDNHPFLTTIAESGTVTPLTSTFPSETAAAVSTIHTGSQPTEHGVLGWNAHIEKLGGRVQTLPFLDQDGTSLREAQNDADPAALIDRQSLYSRLDVDSVLIQPEGIGDNPYDHQTNQGASTVSYQSIPQAAYRVRETIETASEPTYCYCYLPQVDALSHEMGVAHPETDAQLGAICNAVQREIVEKLDPDLAERTLLILTADHGEIDSTPATTVDLDLLDLEPHLKHDSADESIPALGGPRNLQFHTCDGEQDALRTELERGLASLDPLILSREKILEERLFGDYEPSDRFLRRCPDLLAIPAEGFAWYGDDPLSSIGMHGGMHPDEMLVPFSATRIDSLS